MTHQPRNPLAEGTPAVQLRRLQGGRSRGTSTSTAEEAFDLSLSAGEMVLDADLAPAAPPSRGATAPAPPFVLPAGHRISEFMMDARRELARRALEGF